MKSIKIDVRMIAEQLRRRCPFIAFAMLAGPDEDGLWHNRGNLELSVFLRPGTGNWSALEQILPVMSEIVPASACDVTLLNRVDAATRLRAARGTCLFVREGKEQEYLRFVRNAELDYRIMRARGRRRGLIDND